MSAKVDPAEYRRLAAECAEDDARLLECQPSDPHCRMRHRLPAIASALVAAAELAERCEDLEGTIEALQEIYATQSSMNVVLMHERDAARVEVERLQPIFDAAAHYVDHGPAYAGIFHAVETYRAAKGGQP